MHPLNTPLTARLNLKTPIICAPMATGATPELAAAVTATGGLGCIGAGFLSSQVLKEEIQKIRTSLNTPSGEPVPIAVGFLGWVLDRTETSDDPRLLAVLDENVAAVWFAFGVDLEKYVDQVHAYNTRTGRKTFIFVNLSSVEDARRTALRGVDVVVVQGNEAGGHGSADAPPLFWGAPGGRRGRYGISTGAQIASLLTMGVDGVVLGTRFLFTPECNYTAAMKDALLRADLKATVRTMAYDDVGRTNGWPPNFDGRAISNKVMDDLKAGLSVEERLEKFDESARHGDESRLIIWAGVGAGLTSEIKGAADVLRGLHEETVTRLQRSTQLLG
ncbi:hypothetical protein FB451DRAFT_1352600 [Mycena latifolia]|nr:hypothetical protein FB451DRAFT_1352600 [Mycena latifolia]